MIQATRIFLFHRHQHRAGWMPTNLSSMFDLKINFIWSCPLPMKMRVIEIYLYVCATNIRLQAVCQVSVVRLHTRNCNVVAIFFLQDSKTIDIWSLQKEKLFWGEYKHFAWTLCCLSLEIYFLEMLIQISFVQSSKRFNSKHSIWEGNSSFLTMETKQLHSLFFNKDSMSKETMLKVPFLLPRFKKKEWK